MGQTMHSKRSKLLERPLLSKTHLSIKTSFVQSYIFLNVIEPVNKDHQSNATRDRPLYKDHHHLRLCFTITYGIDKIMGYELSMLGCFVLRLKGIQIFVTQVQQQRYVTFDLL